MSRHSLRALALLVTVSIPGASWAQDASRLRLVPMPKQVRLGVPAATDRGGGPLTEGTFALDGPLVLEAPAAAAELLGRMVGEELVRAGLKAPEVRTGQAEANVLRLWAKASKPEPWPPPAFREKATQEDYALEVRPDGVTCAAPGPAGLFYGAQTLCQLIRANRRPRQKGLPCLTVRDWPSLRWRCFQDDMTRGPSSTLATLKLEAALGAGLKMNLFTYYMEYQYAFKKHPLIGPKDGSLTPEDLQALVAYAKPLHVDILGNQQSFGHFERILRHPQYAGLGETPSVLCPVKDESYRLLDDLYSEVCPLLPFEFFNVCCDETWGLGTGPSKELADKIGVGGVYVRHIRRVHDLLATKYHKRMMMWGDIILSHPKDLKDVPKDTIMLTWGYGPAASFEHQIIPFAKSGYEFFVCPGVSNWSRILPDFGTAAVNIRNFARDGAKHGALGMLNTAWEDDGEALNSPKWHGYAWGAECAWNASATTPEDFNRRVGAVLFGEPGDHFGQAIELLAQTHRMAGMEGMDNGRFWKDDFPPQGGPRTVKLRATRLLDVVRPAIEHLEACKKQAAANADLLDGFLLGARRMELIGQRMLDGLEAAQAYTRAWEAQGDRQNALLALAAAEALVRKSRDAHEALGKEFSRLWLGESKPYALDWTMSRYRGVVARYQALAGKLAEARKAAEAGKPLPAPEKLGLAVPEAFDRRRRPHKVVSAPLDADAPWLLPDAGGRLGLLVAAGSADRFDLPVELDLALPADLASRNVRAYCLGPDAAAKPREVLCQLDPSDAPGKTRLTLLIPGPLAKASQVRVFVYLGLPQPPSRAPEAASTQDAPNGMKWLQNDKVRLLLGPQGAHVYRWEVKALKGRDLTMPGQTGWAGFSDMAEGHRDTPHKLTCVARGPAAVRYRCTDASGLVKTVSLFAGASWMEVVLNEPTGHYWDIDAPANFAADGPTPGEYLLSDGKSGPVGKQADGVAAQVKGPRVHWAVKFNKERLAMGLVTPEAAADFRVAPGAGAGGVGIEQSPAAAHFVTYAGLLADGLLTKKPAEVMERLRLTLDFRNPPEVTLHGLQAR